MLQGRQNEVNQYAREMHGEVEKVAIAMKKLEEDLGNMLKNKNV